MKSTEKSTSNLRVLRNGKIVSPKNNTIIKKKSIEKTNKNDHLSILKKGPSSLSNIPVKNLNDSHEMMVSSTNYELRGLCILLKKLPETNEGLFDYQKNNNNNKNCYTNLEDCIKLNEVQIYNKLEAKTEIKPELLTLKKANETVVSPNSLNKKNTLRTKKVGGSIDNQNFEVIMTRGKIIKRQTEERKQLDQIIFNKFPKTTFKMFAIKLDDFSEEVKFLRTLGLICRFKSPLTTYRTKKK